VPLGLAEWTVLSVIAERPVHGFAVAALTAPDGDLGRVWHIPRPVVYRALGRLVDAELIATEAVESGPGPQRTRYSASPAGREAAERWLQTPVEHVREIRSHLLIKLALLDRRGVDPAELLARQREALEPIAAAVSVERRRSAGFDRVLLAWRQAMADAALSFLDDVRPADQARRATHPNLATGALPDHR
jgi:DNA-binding PadR family transcriptional regulator